MTIGVKILRSDLWCQDQSRFKLFLFYRCIWLAADACEAMAKWTDGPPTGTTDNDGQFNSEITAAYMRKPQEIMIPMTLKTSNHKL
jgi:hypothetical protein